MEVLEGGVWDESKTVFAYASPEGREQGIFAFVRVDEATFKAVDLTKVGSGLFSKLGQPSSYYDSFTLKPLEWQETPQGHFLLTVQLRAWRNGQRYTVEGPVIVGRDASVIWQ